MLRNISEWSRKTEAVTLHEFKTLGVLIVLSSIMLIIGLCYLMNISEELEDIRKDVAELKNEMSQEDCEEEKRKIGF